GRGLRRPRGATARAAACTPCPRRLPPPLPPPVPPVPPAPPALPPAWSASPAWSARPAWSASTATAELLDMFCALNGATRTPRRYSHRQIPAVSTLLPASEVVPATNSPPLTAHRPPCSC